jgi:uncharacterized protein CbrC (UPF0167 family)
MSEEPVSEGGVMQETFACDRCATVLPRSRLKEVMHEEHRRRIKEKLCPSCLDAAMGDAFGFRGIVGDEKRAAIHLDHPALG